MSSNDFQPLPDDRRPIRTGLDEQPMVAFRTNARRQAEAIATSPREARDQKFIDALSTEE